MHVPNVGISNAGEVEEKEELKAIVGKGLFWWNIRSRFIHVPGK